MKKIHIVLICFALLPLFACKKNKQTELNQLNVNRAKWNNTNIANYNMVESLICFCAIGGPHHVVVKNNQLISATGNDSPVEHPEKHFKTVDQLFDYIESSLAGKPYQAKIKYDEKYGFPSSIYFDFNEHIIDEEMGYTITDFKTAVAQ